ncbi:MAG: hydrolase [Lysobacteraceae bacterium]|nr:MAG: hydrolase [Xanthomonadaceae bacterium]
MNEPVEDLRVALVQGDTRWHDPQGNRAYYAELIERGAAGADLAVLPETFTSGFSNDALASAETMQGPTLDWMRELAARHRLVLCGSLQCRDGDGVYNRLLWVQPDGQVRHYDKRHLFRMAGEHERYRAGEAAITVELKGWRVRPLVCYDLRFPVFIRNRYGREVPGRLDYDLLVFVANWPAPRREAWRTLLRARAIENLACCVGVNRVGVDGNGVAYAGDSAALDEIGQPLVECGARAMVAVVHLSAAALRSHRERFPAHLDADDFEMHP